MAWCSVKVQDNSWVHAVKRGEDKSLNSLSLYNHQKQLKDDGDIQDHRFVSNHHFWTISVLYEILTKV